MPKIFISYSWEDKAISKKLAACLKRDGAQVWIDYSENKAGDSFIKKMNQGLEWCDTFILLWSSSAAKSNFVAMEWEGALANNLKIIPCLIDNTKLPFILSGRIYKDLSNFDEGYISLAKDLNLAMKKKKIKKDKKPDYPPENKTKSKPDVIQLKQKVLRNTPQELSESDVKNILQQHDFFCKEYNGNKAYCNPTGNGLVHQYKLQELRGDKIIFDNVTGLMWQQSGSSEELDFEDTKKWIIELNDKGFAGFNDWRIPTLEEGMSLMEAEKRKSGLYIDPFFDSQQTWIWTTDKVQDSDWQWVVYFSNGLCSVNYLNNYNYVRSVRSEQSF